MTYEYPFVLLEVPHRAPPKAWVVRDEAHLIEAAAAVTDQDLDDLDQDDLIEVITADLSWSRVITRDDIEAGDGDQIDGLSYWPDHQVLAALEAANEAAAELVATD